MLLGEVLVLQVVAWAALGWTSALADQPDTTVLPPVLSLPPEVVSSLLPDPPAPSRVPFVIVLEPSEPPGDGRAIHIENQAHIEGTEAPRFTPARNLDLVVDPGPLEPLQATLLVCPRASLQTLRRLWVRDNLGDGQWRAAVALSASVFIGGVQPCGEIHFMAASPAAVLLGHHEVTAIPLTPVRDLDEQRRVGLSLAASWDLEFSSVQPYAAEGLDGQLVFVARENRWELLFTSPRGVRQVSARPGAVEVSWPDHRQGPLVLCVDGRAAVLESICPPGVRRCEYALRFFGTCTAR